MRSGDVATFISLNIQTQPNCNESYPSPFPSANVSSAEPRPTLQPCDALLRSEPPTTRSDPMFSTGGKKFSCQIGKKYPFHTGISSLLLQ